MAYTRSVPTVNDSKSGSRPKIEANFQSISDTFEVNHDGFNESEAGKHKFVSVLNVDSAGSGSIPTGGVTEGVIYSDKKDNRFNPYYKFDTGGDWNATDANKCPLLPIKCIGLLDTSSFDANESWNIDSAVRSTPTGLIRWVVNMHNPMRSTNYGVYGFVFNTSGNTAQNKIEPRSVTISSNKQFIVNVGTTITTTQANAQCYIMVVGI